MSPTFGLSLLLALTATAPNTSAGGGDIARFAVVIGSNSGPAAARPDLHYADDDAIRFASFFDMLGVPTRLVTRPDEESRERAPPSLTPPTQAGVAATVAAAAADVARALARGRRAELYFVFAGHGSVDAGRGYLELEDARIGSDGLARLIDQVGADRTHVVLDACNAFFVVYPRRPGGRIVATTADVTAGITPARGDLAVMLSTSAEADVFEWSHLEAGIFSHVLRSGSTGAADADDDGTISYREMEEFVGVAVSTLPHGPYRPRVFMRAPDGAVFADLRGATGARVPLGALERRVTVRDERGTRVADLHRVPERARELLLPAGAYTLASERGLRELHVYQSAVADGGAVDAEVHLAVRGSDATLERLFAKPFSIENIAQFHAEKDTAGAESIGLSHDAEQRLAALVDAKARESHDERIWRAAGVGGMSVAGAASFAPLLMSARDGAEVAVVVGGMGAVLGIGATLATTSALAPSKIERVSAELNAEPSEATRARRVGRALNELDELAASGEFDRNVAGVAAIGFGVVGTALGVAALTGIRGYSSVEGLLYTDPINNMLTSSLLLMPSTMLMVGGAQSLLVPSPEERFVELVRTDHELAELQPAGAAP